MNYSKILVADIANGLGFRTTLWCTGCARKCPGCFNKDAQDPNFGQKFDEEAKRKLIAEIGKPTCDGLSLMGGEPLSQLSDNRKVMIDLCREVKEKYPEKDIWMWSGYSFEDIFADPTMSPILDYIDVLVDGPFVEGEKDLSCPFRGSKNQRVLDIAKWRSTNEMAELY